MNESSETETTQHTPTQAGSKNWEDKVVSFFSPKWKKLKIPALVGSLLLVLLIALLFNRIFINIFPGESGVLWKRFSGGTDENVIYEEGLHIINPFNKMYVYEMRLQQRDTEFTVLSQNGLLISIKASVRFKPQRENLPLLHKQVGPEYIDRVVLPQVQSVIRKVIGSYKPDEIYGTQGDILKNITLDALGELRERYIILDELLIRELTLPPTVSDAIERKLQQEQRSLEYEFRLYAEKQEIERKKLEAEGIKAFQEGVLQNMTPEYLAFRGIQATLELAQSPNSKIILIGNKESGLPLILNAESANQGNQANQGMVPTGSLQPTPSKQVDSEGNGAATKTRPAATETQTDQKLSTNSSSR